MLTLARPEDAQDAEIQATNVDHAGSDKGPTRTAQTSANEDQRDGLLGRILRRIYPTRETESDSVGAPRAQGLPSPAVNDRSRRSVTQERPHASEESVLAEDDAPMGVRLSQRRLDALQKIDDKIFSWFHIKLCLITGVGFFADAYDMFAINLTSVILDFVYSSTYDDQAGVLKIDSDTSKSNMLKVSSPVGTFVGQLVFGFIADKVGRKRIYGIELIIIVIGTLGQVFCANGPKGTVSIHAALSIWRLVLGVGIGGDYPMSAVYPSECAPKRTRGRMMTAVYSSQGFGQLVAGIVSLIVIQGFKNNFPSDGNIALAQTHADHAWRIILALGCVPAAIAIRFRLTIPESPRFTMDIERNVRRAEKDIKTFFETSHWQWDENSTATQVQMPTSHLADFMDHFGNWSNLKRLLACGHASLAVNVAFYGLAMNTSTLFCSVGVVQSVVACTVPAAAAGHNTSTSAFGGTVFNVTLGPDSFFDPHDVLGGLTDLAAASTIFAAVGLVLGYAAALMLIDHPSFGRKRLQHFGFGALTLLSIILGAVLKAAPTLDTQPPAAHALFGGGGWSHALIALAVLAAFCMSCGPSATTFIIPGEQFPTRHRATCHGLSAAVGKLWQAVLMFIPFMVTGMLATRALEETSGEKLEDLTNEPQGTLVQCSEEESQHTA
ncbi:phosphate permease [Phanerochaete sordida]|uniref:Phosphate permease n=1 Tax=Phanerochaete sordida TaxID=48140 RepID=A0A9P3GGD3_9APHY|nr:phosphate permease [Phanerochaete sordida]